jgi:hypothetical protein
VRELTLSFQRHWRIYPVPCSTRGLESRAPEL